MTLGPSHILPTASLQLQTSIQISAVGFHDIKSLPSLAITVALDLLSVLSTTPMAQSNQDVRHAMPCSDPAASTTLSGCQV
jgi:hypothetical protein